MVVRFVSWNLVVSVRVGEKDGSGEFGGRIVVWGMVRVKVRGREC